MENGSLIHVNLISRSLPAHRLNRLHNVPFCQQRLRFQQRPSLRFFPPGIARAVCLADRVDNSLFVGGLAQKSMPAADDRAIPVHRDCLYLVAAVGAPGFLAPPFDFGEPPVGCQRFVVERSGFEGVSQKRSGEISIAGIAGFRKAVVGALYPIARTGRSLPPNATAYASPPARMIRALSFVQSAIKQNFAKPILHGRTATRLYSLLDRSQKDLLFAQGYLNVSFAATGTGDQQTVRTAFKEAVTGLEKENERVQQEDPNVHIIIDSPDNLDKRGVRFNLHQENNAGLSALVVQIILGKSSYMTMGEFGSDSQRQQLYEVPDRWFRSVAQRLAKQKNVPTYGDLAAMLELTPMQLAGLNNLLAGGGGTPYDIDTLAGVPDLLRIVGALANPSAYVYVGSLSPEIVDGIALPRRGMPPALRGTTAAFLSARRQISTPADTARFHVCLTCYGPQSTDKQEEPSPDPRGKVTVVVEWNPGSGQTPYDQRLQLYLPTALPDDRSGKTKVEVE